MRRTRRYLIALACVLVGSFAMPTAAHGSEPNSGTPGSACRASDGGVFTPPGTGVTTSGLGAGAPAYYEIGAPTGVYAGRAPKAIMLVIHGGGWFLVGKGVLAEYGRPLADRWRRAGWKTVNIDYRACGQSVRDVLWFMERVRTLHPKAVICATGSSAGGHLTMLLAGLRKDLACAISHAGPTDLVALDSQRTYDQTGALTREGSARLSNWAIAAFGTKPDPLRYSSPKQFASRVTARTLLATGRTDPLVPRAQDASFAKALRAARPEAYVEVMSLPPGPSWFVHTGVTQWSLAHLRQREDALVAPLLAKSAAKKVGMTG